MHIKISLHSFFDDYRVRWESASENLFRKKTINFKVRSVFFKKKKIKKKPNLIISKIKKVPSFGVFRIV
jgi:hypothetical protein